MTPNVPADVGLHRLRHIPSSSDGAGHPRLPRIALVSPTSGVVTLLGGVAGERAMGGAETQMAEMGRLLRDRGWDVTFIVSDAAGQPDDYRHAGFRFVTGYRAHYTERGRRSLIMRVPGARFWGVNLPCYWRSLQTADADVYVFRGASRLVGIAAAFCRIRNRAFVFSTAHDTDVGARSSSGTTAGKGRLFRYGLRRADMVLVQHEGQRRLLRVQMNLEGTLLPSIATFRVRPPSEPAGNVVVWIGSIRAVKRPLLALEIAEALPNATFRFIGWRTPDMDAGIETEFAARAETMPNVELVGFLPHEQMPDHFREAKLLLHTSPPGGEGFPNVFLEAWAHGVPVVCSFDPGGIVQARGIGCVASSSADFVRELTALLTDGVRRRRMALAAAEYVRTEHSAEAVADRLDGALRDLLQRWPLLPPLQAARSI